MKVNVRHVAITAVVSGLLGFVAGVLVPERPPSWRTEPVPAFAYPVTPGPHDPAESDRRSAEEEPEPPAVHPSDV